MTLHFIQSTQEFDWLDTRFPFWTHILSEATRQEANLLAQPEEKLRVAARGGQLIVALSEDNSAVIGCIALWPLGEDALGVTWYELGTVYVNRDSRGHGYGAMLMNYALDVWAHQNIMSTSKEHPFIHIAMNRHAMTPVTASSVPQVIPLTCICTIVDGVPERATCPYRDGTCVFLLAESTFYRTEEARVRDDAFVRQIRNHHPPIVG